MAAVDSQKTEVIKDILPVKLTDEERMQCADALANALQSITDAKNKKKQTSRACRFALALL